MKKVNMIRIGLCVLLAGSSLVFVSCTKREKSTAIGAVVGGGLGLGVGAAVGGGTGAAIGGAGGALTGGLIGHSVGKDNSKK
jgi:outer membrane lipoprotein SlyB